MAEISSFFNSVEKDRVYYAEDFARHLKKYFTNGIFNNELAVKANNDMTITIKPGDANIEGYRYSNTADLIKGIEVADGVLKRIDNVVLRLDLTNRLISAQIIKGSYSEQPTAPALVRSTTIYDIKLAEITIDNGITSITQSAIKDTRPDTNLCGIVTSTVKTLDITDVYEQLYAKYNELIEQHNNEWGDWYDKLKNSIDTWFKETQKNYSDKLGKFETDFNAWFDTIKGKLSGDIAGNLQNQIDEVIDSSGNKISIEIDPDTYIMTLKLKNKDETILSTDTVDLPLETMVVNASYDNATKEIELTLQNGKTTRFSVADLVSGLVSKEEDPTVPSHVKSISRENIANWNSKANSTDIPTKVSQLTNDMLVKCSSEEEAKSKSTGDTQHLYYTVEE